MAPAVEGLEGRAVPSTYLVAMAGPESLLVTTAGRSGNVKSCELVDTNAGAVKLADTGLHATIEGGTFVVKTAGPTDLAGTLNGGGVITTTNCDAVG